MYTGNEWFNKTWMLPLESVRQMHFFLSSFEWQAMIDSLLVLKQSADTPLIKFDSRSAQNQQYLSPASFSTASNITIFMITFVNSKATSPADKSLPAVRLFRLHTTESVTDLSKEWISILDMIQQQTETDSKHDIKTVPLMRPMKMEQERKEGQGLLNKGLCLIH